MRSSGLYDNRLRPSAPGLQRLDFHFAEFHHAPIVRDALVVFHPQPCCERDPAAGNFEILRAVHCFLPVELLMKVEPLATMS